MNDHSGKSLGWKAAGFLFGIAQLLMLVLLNDIRGNQKKFQDHISALRERVARIEARMP